MIDYDRILVISGGELAEFDSPHALLSNSESLFYKMVEDTGEANARLLRERAMVEESHLLQKKLDSIKSL